MNAGRAMLLTALFLVALLAGCSQKGDDPPTVVQVAPDDTIQEITEPPKPSKGNIMGIVGDDAVYPLRGATIYVLGLGINTTTDKNGRFAFRDIQPGIYLLEGDLKDHAVAQTTVDVQPGDVARAVLILPRIPPTDPYHSTWHEEAFVEFDGGISSSRNTTLRWDLDPSKAKTLVVEASWQGTILSQDNTPFDYHIQEAGLREIVGGQAGNPFSTHMDARILPPGKDRFLYSMEPRFPDVVAFQATGELYLTVFYNADAPPEWSVLSGST